MATLSTNKTSGTYKCPMCAETIPVVSTRCEYCGAQFSVTSSGYCQTCHEVRDADGTGRCQVCSDAVMDWQFSTTLKQAPPQPVAPAPPEPAPTGEVDATELVVLPIRGEGVNLRSSAVFIDVCLIAMLYLVVLVLIMLTTQGLRDLTSLDFDAVLSITDDLMALVLIPIVWFIYFFLLEGAFGATPGKSLSHLRVIKKGGGRISFGQAAVRAALGMLEINPIGAIVIWLTPLRQRFGDLLAGTMVVNREKLHKAEFNPPAITFEFHDYRRVAFTQITSGLIYKFGMIRELRLRGAPLPGSPKQLNLRGRFFRAEFNMLCRNIELRYNQHFREKIMVWRLVAVLLFVIASLTPLVYYISQFSGKTPSQNLPAIFTTATPRVYAALQLTPTLQPNVTIRPTSTPRPTQTHTPLPVEINFDTIGDYPVRQPVILVGRLTLFSSTLCSDTCGLLLENPEKPTQKITIFVPVGDGNNQMKPLPDSYTKSDIQVRLDDGTLAVIGYRIRVTGRICETTGGEPCISDITKMELFQVK
jgi:uncharacterized RDD family membrane protein YckC